MKNFKFDWGHGVVLLLGSFMIFITTLILSAGDTGDLVSDEYYEESLVYQEESLDAQKRAQALSEKPVLKNQANGILLTFPEDQKPTEGVVQMMRPSNISQDFKIPLKLNNRNQILLPAVKLVPGEYDLSLFWTVNGEKYLVKKTIQWNMP